MPLYDVTNREVEVSSDDASSYEVIEALRRHLPKSTFDRLVKTVDEMIDQLRPSEKSKFVWTRMAAILGRGSLGPKKHIDHLWDKVISVVGEDRLSLMAVGGLLRWRISLRQEMWLVYRRDSDEQDKETGKLITVSEYWINPKYVPEKKPKQTIVQSIENLRDAWGAR